MENDLTLKYRPKDWSDMVGQDDVIKSIQSVLRKETKRSFLFTGQSGIGKTTAARILVDKVGCRYNNLKEINGASHTGIDKMREIIEHVIHKPFGESNVIVVIVDECHQISKQAWQSILKIVEEPPEHVYWIFCTTEPSKIPPTIKTRCASFQFQPVKTDVILDLLIDVASNECFKTPEEVLRVVARQSLGSPSQALSYLAQCYACHNVKDACNAIQSANEEGEAITLIRAVVKGGLTWSKAMRLLEPVRNQSAESIRLVMLQYLSTTAMGSKTNDQVGRVLEIMDCFSEPYNSSEGMAPLLLSLGRYLIADGTDA